MITFNERGQLSVKLTCQAPIIHFQPKTLGATLRASEVKPKFDAYIKSQEGKIPEEWYLKDDADALNYKMRFEDEKSMFIEKGRGGRKDAIPMYYANDEKRRVWTNPTLMITCFIPKLQDVITKHLESFFIVSNFGAVQGKGYGSFTVGSHEKIDIVKVLRKEFGTSKIYCMEGFSAVDHSKEVLFERIKEFYTLTKSGINFRGKYQRSSLFLYMHEEKNIDNEKAEVKQRDLVSGYFKESDKVWKNKNPKFVRALLGLSARMDFRKGSERESVKIGHLKRSIERFASPIFFKIIDNRVYIVPREIDQRMYNQTFVFRGNKRSIELETPDSSEFDIQKFLNYAVKSYNKHGKRLFGHDFVEIKSYILRST